MEKDTKHSDDSENPDTSSKKTKGFSALFHRANASADMNADAAAPKKEKEYVCEGARYAVHPSVEALAQNLYLLLKQRKPKFPPHKQTEYLKDIDKYEQAFAYANVGDLSDAEKQHLCEMQKLQRRLLGVILDEDRRKAQEQNQQHQLERQQQNHEKQLQEQRFAHVQDRIKKLKKQKNEQQELIQDLINHNKETTRFAYISLGLSSTVALAGIAATVYAVSQGKLSHAKT
jgi:hypothetical protein